MLESFFIENHLKEVDAQWRQKTLVSCEILGKAALRYLRPEIKGDRTRLDLMWNGKALGIRGRSKPDGSHEFYNVSEPDTTVPVINQMMRELVASAPPLKQAQLRFRSGHNGERGIWIDTSNEQIKGLLEEGRWLRALLDMGWLIEVGQRQRRIMPFEDSVKISDPKSETWLPSFDVDNREIPLQSYISIFSQPGPEANRALIAAGFDLLDRAEVPRLAWVEWGAGYGNLSAAYASRLGTQGFSSEMEAAAALLLEQNAKAFFTGVETECRAAEKGLPADRPPFDLWLLDPPRPGFAKLLEGLAREGAPAPLWILAYHCHGTGLIADSKWLRTAGFSLLEWSSVDVFPATPHHEVVSLWKNTRRAN